MHQALEAINGTLAWKKEDILQVLCELIEDKYAVIGSDAWAIVQNSNEIQNELIRIDADRIAIGIIKGKDNNDYVFSWSCDKNFNEGWEDFIIRSKNEAVDTINKMDAENTVITELRNFIYYNLIFVNEFEYKNLNNERKKV
jgi:hypothetical protein